MAHTPTEEQLRNRELATQNIEQGLAQDTGISSQDLTPTGLPTITQPDIPAISDITQFKPEVTPPVEDITPVADASNVILKRIFEIQPELAQEVGFRVEQKDVTGLTGFEAAETDLVAQIQSFQLKALDLANQKTLAVERIQQEFAGRGATRGGIAPLTAAAQRRITLQQADIASQALTAMATLSAVQGKIVTATRQVEEAVAQKFGALKAEKDALIENLELLVDSGVLTREETKRAEAQKARQEALKAEIERQETETLIVQKFAVEVAPQLAKLPNGTQLIDAMFKMDNIADATQFASAMGVLGVEPELTQQEQLRNQLLETQLATANLKLTEAQKAANNATPAGVLERLTDDQRSAYFKLVDKFEANSSEFFKVRDAFNRVVTSAEDPSAAGDLALIFNFMKTLDPGSVVRESEFATAAAAGSFLDRTYGFGLKLKEGQRLAPDQRQDFLDRSIKLFETAKEQQQTIVDTFEDRASKFGIPAGNVTRAIDAVKQPSQFNGINKGEEEEIDEILGIQSFFNIPSI